MGVSNGPNCLYRVSLNGADVGRGVQIGMGRKRLPLNTVQDLIAAGLQFSQGYWVSGFAAGIASSPASLRGLV